MCESDVKQISNQHHQQRDGLSKAFPCHRPNKKMLKPNSKLRKHNSDKKVAQAQRETKKINRASSTKSSSVPTAPIKCCESPTKITSKAQLHNKKLRKPDAKQKNWPLSDTSSELNKNSPLPPFTRKNAKAKKQMIPKSRAQQIPPPTAAQTKN
jgi:hypothetical protein